MMNIVAKPVVQYFIYYETGWPAPHEQLKIERASPYQGLKKRMTHPISELVHSPQTLFGQSLIS